MRDRDDDIESDAYAYTAQEDEMEVITGVTHRSQRIRDNDVVPSSPALGKSRSKNTANDDVYWPGDVSLETKLAERRKRAEQRRVELKQAAGLKRRNKSSGEKTKDDDE